MDKKEIEKVAYEAWELNEHSSSIQFVDGFKEGAEWALSLPKEVEPKKEVDLEELREEWIKRSDYIKKVKGVDTDEIWNIFEPNLQKPVESEWISVDIEPEFGGEYNVVYDLEDGGELITTTMDYDKINKLWMDTRGANIPIYTVLLWQPLPQPPKTNSNN